MSIIRTFFNKYKNIPTAVKASLWFIIASIIQKGISFLTTPIFTRIMTTEEYGTFSIYQSWYAIVLIFTSLNLAGGVLNNGLTKYPDKKDSFVSSLLGLTSIITIGFFVGYILFSSEVNRIFELDTPYILFMFLQLLFEPAYLLWSAKLRFEYKYRPLIVVSLLIAIITPCISVICVVLARDKALARVASVVLVQVCIYISIYLLVILKGKRLYNRRHWRYALAFNIPLIPHYLSMTVLNQSDRIMIQYYCGKEYVAIYSVAYSLSMLMTIISSAINSSFVPYIYKKMKANEMERIKKVSVVISLIMAGFSILPVFLGPELITILASSAYYQAIWIIPPVSCSVFFIFLYNLFGTIEFYYEKNKFIMIASVVGAIVNIVLNAIFIPMYGFVAAGYTTLFCYVLFSIAHFLFAISILKSKGIIKIPFDIKKLGIISLLILTATIGFSFLYQYTILRYIIFAILLIIFVLNAKRILSIYKSMK